MADERRYKILELSTQGWTLVDSDAQNLTRSECDVRLKQILEVTGVAPDRLKVAAQNDPRYAADAGIDPDKGYIPENTQ